MVLSRAFFSTIWLISLSSVYAQESCSLYRSCLECTQGNDKLLIGESFCVWQADFPTFVETSVKHVNFYSKCVSEEHTRSMYESSSAVFFEDRCPVYHDQNDSDQIDLSNWMSALSPVIGEKASVLDLALPGTHDTLSYDLSLQISDAGIDDHDTLSKLLHTFSGVLPDSLADYMRQQAMTQPLSVISQLNNGARFLDIRMMYEKSADDWFSLHMLQSNEPILSYMKEIHNWMQEHPSEIVVMWVSKHGNTCSTGEEQYPGVSIDTKQAMFQSILDIFADVVMDTDLYAMNTTSINTLVETNNRAIFLMSDFEEMAVGDNRNKALDACQVLENVLSPSIADESYADWQKDFYESSIAKKEDLKKQNKMLLLSLASGVPGEQMVDAAAVRFLKAGKVTEGERISKRCATVFHIDGMDWCPESLSDVSNLLNYYNQDGMKNALQQQTEQSMFPHAIYINGMDIDGGIRTGTSCYWGMNRSSKEDHALTTFAYVPSMIASTVVQFCSGDMNEQCEGLMEKLKMMINAHPAIKWKDPQVGRLD